MKLTATIACHCSANEDSAHMDLGIANKIMTLGAENELLTSEIFKNKYEATKEESNLRFNPRGIYTINTVQMEIFQVSLTK